MVTPFFEDRKRMDFMTNEEITLALHGPVPFPKAVRKLSERQCYDILAALERDEKGFRNPTPLARSWWASAAPSHMSGDFQKAALKDLERATQLIYDRLAQLGVRRGLA